MGRSNQIVVGAGNSALWTVSIPNNSTFLGIQSYNQGLALDGPANAAGLTASNGGKGRVGLWLALLARSPGAQPTLPW